jgi:hypothetical protein
VTVARLLWLRGPEAFAPWYRAGVEYVRRVAVGMGFDADGLDARADTGDRALRAGEVPGDGPARAVATVLLGDAVFTPPYLTWMPGWYRAALSVPAWVLRRKLTGVARRYAPRVTSPAFSTAGTVRVEGSPAVAHVEGFRDRFVLAAAVLHLEWFVDVAPALGVSVPDDLVERTRRESVEHFTGLGELGPEPRRFQAFLFSDDKWCRRVDEAYDLDSRLFGLWERLLRDTREALEISD